MTMSSATWITEVKVPEEWSQRKAGLWSGVVRCKVVFEQFHCMSLLTILFFFFLTCIKTMSTHDCNDDCSISIHMVFWSAS